VSPESGVRILCLRGISSWSWCRRARPPGGCADRGVRGAVWLCIMFGKVLSIPGMVAVLTIYAPSRLSWRAYAAAGLLGKVEAR